MDMSAHFEFETNVCGVSYGTLKFVVFTYGHIVSLFSYGHMYCGVSYRTYYNKWD